MLPKKNKHILLIKLGGSVVTDKSKPSTLNLPIIHQLSQELSDGIKKTDSLVILSHGAGSFGHPQAAKFHTADGYTDENSLMGFALVRQAVTKLNKVVIDELIKKGLPALAFSPVSFITSRHRKPKSLFLEPLEIILKNRLVPVIHGDVTLDSIYGWTILSGETILNNIAIELLKRGYKIDKMIEIGATQGVYNVDGKTIPEVSKQNFSNIEKFLTDSKHTDITGGMLHKVKEALNLAKSSIPTYIISSDKGNLVSVITNQKVRGTIIR